MDFGPPRTLAMRAISLVLRRLEETSDLFNGLLPGFLAEAGFSQAAENRCIPTMLGPMTFYRAVKPVPGGAQ